MGTKVDHGWERRSCRRDEAAGGSAPPSHPVPKPSWMTSLQNACVVLATAGVPA